MPDYTFLIPLTTTTIANAQATLSYNVASAENLAIKSIRQKSTGAFDIQNIRNSDGFSYTSGSGANPIDSDFIADIADTNNKLVDFPLPIQITQNKTIYFDVKDTSGAGNTIKLFLSGVRTVG